MWTPRTRPHFHSPRQGLTNGLPYQKSNRAAICRTRGAEAVVICPNVAEFLVAFGESRSSWSNTLNASIRSSIRWSFTLESRKIFVSDMSVLNRLGPRNEFMVRGALPYCPSSGNVQTVADVLNHCAIFSSCERSLGSVGSPLRFGRCPEQPLPHPVRARSTPENTVIGVPDR